MRDDTAGHPATDAEAVLPPAEANRRKAVLRRLKDELAARSVESVLAGRHVLRLSTAAPWSQSGPINPELHIPSTGIRITTDGHRYQLTDGTVHDTDDPASAADHVIAAEVRNNAGPGQPAPSASDDPAPPTRVIGPGEQALRQLIDDGII
jgi:hypothetical protein